jgi:hypothetical protein
MKATTYRSTACYGNARAWIRAICTPETNVTITYNKKRQYVNSDKGHLQTTSGKTRIYLMITSYSMSSIYPQYFARDGGGGD